MTSLKPFIVFTWLILQFYFIQCDQKKPSVIIVGAGAAGIAAGCRLIQNGISDVTVLEAENRIGGRIHSVDFDGDVIELGAASLQADEDDPIFVILNSSSIVKLSDFNMTASIFVDPDGNEIPTDINTNTQIIIDDILADFESMDDFKLSIAKFLMKSLESNEEAQKIDEYIKEKYLSWYMKMERSTSGVNSLHQLPAKVYSEYWKDRSNKLWIADRPGMKVLLDALMNKFSTTSKPYPLEEKIILNKEVKNINWSTDNTTNVVVTCSDGSQYTADHVILTVSLGVLKKDADTLFTPELPAAKKTAIRYLGFGKSEVYYLKFANRWWPEIFEGFSLLWNKNSTNELFAKFGDEYKNKQWLTHLFGFYRNELSDNILEPLFTGGELKYTDGLTDDEVKNGIMDALKMFVGKNYTIPEPVAFARSHWYSNPHFRGLNSYISTDTIRHKTGPSELERSLYKDINRPLVIFAGEATRPESYGTIEGAIQSGWLAADSVLGVYD